MICYINTENCVRFGAPPSGGLSASLRRLPCPGWTTVEPSKSRSAKSRWWLIAHSILRAHHRSLSSSTGYKISRPLRSRSCGETNFYGESCTVTCRRRLRPWASWTTGESRVSWTARLAGLSCSASDVTGEVTTKVCLPYQTKVCLPYLERCGLRSVSHIWKGWSYFALNCIGLLYSHRLFVFRKCLPISLFFRCCIL